MLNVNVCAICLTTARMNTGLERGPFHHRWALERWNSLKMYGGNATSSLADATSNAVGRTQLDCVHNSKSRLIEMLLAWTAFYVSHGSPFIFLFGASFKPPWAGLPRLVR
jgi:hypothetical protein